MINEPRWTRDGSDGDIDLGNYERFSPLKFSTINAMIGVRMDTLWPPQKGKAGWVTEKDTPDESSHRQWDHRHDSAGWRKPNEDIDSNNANLQYLEIILIELGSTVAEYDSWYTQTHSLNCMYSSIEKQWIFETIHRLLRLENRPKSTGNL
jgi:hypothetical protein